MRWRPLLLYLLVLTGMVAGDWALTRFVHITVLAARDLWTSGTQTTERAVCSVPEAIAAQFDQDLRDTEAWARARGASDVEVAQYRQALAISLLQQVRCH